MATESIARQGIAALFLALSLGATASAAEVAGVTVADEVSVGGPKLMLNGAGLRHKFFFRIYVGSLYLPRKVGDLEGVLAIVPRRIQMNFLRHLTVNELVGAVVGGLVANNSPAEMAAVEAQVEDLLQIMQRFNDVDIKERDVLTLDFIDGGTAIALNGAAGGVPRRHYKACMNRTLGRTC